MANKKKANAQAARPDHVAGNAGSGLNGHDYRVDAATPPPRQADTGYVRPPITQQAFVPDVY